MSSVGVFNVESRDPKSGGVMVIWARLPCLQDDISLTNCRIGRVPSTATAAALSTASFETFTFPILTRITVLLAFIEYCSASFKP